MALAAIGLGLTAGGEGYSIHEQRVAQKQQEKQQRLDQRRAEIANIRNRRKAIAQARVLQGQLENQAAVTGTSQSSGFQGQESALRSQASERVGAQAESIAINQEIANAQQQEAAATGRATTGRAVAQVPSTFGLPTSFDIVPTPNAQTDAELASFGFNRKDVGLS